MADVAWWLVAVLALACVVLLGLLWRQRRQPAAPRLSSAPPATPAAQGDRRASVAVPVGGVPGGGLAPLPGPTAVRHPPVAALVAPPTVRLPAMLVAARARRYELRDNGAEPAVILERVGAGEWQTAPPAVATPMQCQLLAIAFAHAPLLAESRGGASDLYRLSVRAGTALTLARGELAESSLRVLPAQALDAAHAPALAALVLALHCMPVHLRMLRREVAAIQADSAPWLRSSSAGDERLRALLQDLSRHLREVEENHAGAIRKPVFVAQVAEYCVQAEAQWRAASDAAAALRQPMAVLANQGGTDEADWLGRAQAYALRRSVACSAARMLAAWHGLRLALGEAVPAAALVLNAARRTQRAAGADELAMARSSAARRWGWPVAAEAGERAERALAGVLQAIEGGFSGNASLTLLVRLDSLGQVCELRGPLVAA
jgi:hypothetical protein